MGMGEEEREVGRQENFDSESDSTTVYIEQIIQSSWVSVSTL